MSGSGSLVSRLRRPEHTGENRCLPCTVLNVGVAAAGSVLVVLWGTVAGFPGAAVALGAASLALSLASIWLRGYLVPGTPTLTKRYLPERVLDLFGKAPPRSPSGVHGSAEDRAGTDGADLEELDAEGVLEAAGAIEPCRGDDRCLTDAFRAEWDEQLDAVREREDPASLLARLAVEADDATVADRGEALVVTADGRQVGAWESRPAFEADLAAASVLADRVDGWESLSANQRGRLCNGLRIFLETCPACGGPLAFGTETVESCCSSRTVAAVTCDDCDVRVFESPVDEEELGA